MELIECLNFEWCSELYFLDNDTAKQLKQEQKNKVLISNLTRKVLMKGVQLHRKDAEADPTTKCAVCFNFAPLVFISSELPHLTSSVVFMRGCIRGMEQSWGFQAWENTKT